MHLKEVHCNDAVVEVFPGGATLLAPILDVGGSISTANHHNFMKSSRQVGQRC
jgi:hypothetical protein